MWFKKKKPPTLEDIVIEYWPKDQTYHVLFRGKRVYKNSENYFRRDRMGWYGRRKKEWAEKEARDYIDYLQRKNMPKVRTKLTGKGKGQSSD